MDTVPSTGGRTSTFWPAAEQTRTSQCVVTGITPSTLEVELPRQSNAPRGARRAIDEFLHDRCISAVTEAVLMVASELVTNAIRHTSGGCHLSLRLTQTEVVVEVRDNDVPATDATDLDGDLFGRGLGIVQSITRRWGIEQHPAGGKIVWAEVPIS